MLDDGAKAQEIWPCTLASAITLELVLKWEEVLTDSGVSEPKSEQKLQSWFLGEQ